MIKEPEFKSEKQYKEEIRIRDIKRRQPKVKCFFTIKKAKEASRINNNSNHKRLYRTLSPEEREEIMIGLRQIESIRAISKRLGRNQSVILREIKKNSTEDGRYQAFWAHKLTRRCWTLGG